MMKFPIVNAARMRLQQLADASAAKTMAAYMKTSMPFYGVRATDRRALVKELSKLYPINTQQDYLEIVETLWHQPHREEKYIAIDIARAYPHYADIAAIPLFEKIIREGAWWDFVDDVAINLIGHVLMHHPVLMWPIIEQWINDPDIWIARTAIICQNKFKKKTDEKRLFSFCLQRAHEKNFFMKKAIGWALREYAKTETEAVYIFVEQHSSKLSQLSYKEATKHKMKKNI